MRICILSKDNEPLGFLDNEISEGLHFYDDTLHIYFTGTAHTFEFSVIATEEAADLLKVGNKISFIYKDRGYYMSIMNTEQDEEEIKVEAWSYCLELLNEKASSYEPAEAHTFLEYFNTMIFTNDIFEVGVNEVSTYKRKLEFSNDTDTLLARIYSLATNFDAEVEFIPQLNADYSLDKFLMNVFKEHSDTDQGIGERREDEYFRYGKDVDGVTKTQDISELYTMIVPTGKDGLTIASLGERKVYDDDGNLLYWHPNKSAAIYAPIACQNFPSAVTSKDKYIRYDWDTEYSSVETLYGNALAKLKTLSAPESTYEIEGNIDVNVGDTITVIDEAFSPPLYLETRVTEQEISFTDPTKGKATFSNTKELETAIDSTLLKRMEEIKKTAESAATAASTAQETATSAQSAAESANTTALSAQSAAETAQSTATTAQETATAAQTTAETANTAASEAKTTAESANTTALSAQSTAESAQSTANTANSTANTAKSTADSASETAATANTNANEAKETAESASTTASAAQSAANTANETANAASTAASNAQSAAETAQSTADNAASAAETAQSTANTAKAATDNLNTLIRETTDGVEVAKVDSDGAYTGMRTEQTSDAYLIKDKDGNELASYGADTVKLGKGNANAVIDMCDGTTTITSISETISSETYYRSSIAFNSGGGTIEAVADYDSVCEFNLSDFEVHSEASIVTSVPEWTSESETYRAANADFRITSVPGGSVIKMTADDLWLTESSYSESGGEGDIFAMSDVIKALSNGLQLSTRAFYHVFGVNSGTTYSSGDWRNFTTTNINVRSDLIESTANYLVICSVAIIPTANGIATLRFYLNGNKEAPNAPSFRTTNAVLAGQFSTLTQVFPWYGAYSNNQFVGWPQIYANVNWKPASAVVYLVRLNDGFAAK